MAEERRQYADALALLERLLTVDPEAEHAAVLAAQLHERLGDDEAAVACYRALIELEPRQRGRWLGELGRLYVRLGDKGHAIGCFDDALRLAPDNPAVFRELARAFESMGERARARECLRQVLRLRPDDGDSRLALANLLIIAPAEEEPRGEEQAEELALTVARGADTALAKRGRAWLFDRLDERGEVQATIERLRAELKQNPFDTHRPLELFYLFVRQDEYELALELLDELLAFRPNDAALLRQRAGLHKSLQRYDAALADYAALQRLPDVERDEVLMRSAECHVQAGDLARADELLQQVADRMEVFSLYRRVKLLDRALGVLKQELERTPEDVALLELLVALQQERREPAQALAAFERASALVEETPQRLRRRAQLLSTAGDREGYTAALVQSLLVIEPPVGPAGEAAANLSKGARRALRDETRRVQGETSALQSQLSQDREHALWSEVVQRAALAAPLREEFVGPAFSNLVAAERFDEAAALVELCRKELAAGRCPVGQTMERWRRTLDSRDNHLVRADPQRAAARADELAAMFADDAGSVTPERIRELVALHTRDDDRDALLALYEFAAERFPNESRYVAAAAALHIEQGDEASALPYLRRLLEAGGLPAGADPLRPHRRDRARLEASLPAALVPLVTDELVTRQRRLEARAGLEGAWAVGVRPSRADVEVALAPCLAATDERGEAHALLAGQEPSHPEHTSRGCFVARVYAELGFDDDARRLTAMALHALEAAADEPVLCTGVTFTAEARALMADHARGMVAAGEVARGFELMRRWSGAEAAQEVLRTQPDLAPLRAELEASWSAARASTASADVTATVDRGVLLLDVLVHAGDWAAAGAIADELATLAPTSMPIALVAFELDRRRGDTAKARARLETAIAAVKDEARRTGVIPPPVRAATRFSQQAPLRQKVVDLAPPALAGPVGTTREVVEQALSFMNPRVQVLGPEAQAERDRWAPWVLEAELCDLDWAAGSWAAVAERLERLFAAIPSGMTWITDRVQHAAARVPADAGSLPFWEFVYERGQHEVGNVAKYGAALEAAGRADDALRIYRKFARAHAGNNRAREIEQRIARLDSASVVAVALPADLAAAVAADPKNVALRRALVQQLLDERRYDDAADQALTLEQLAPHLDDVLALCEDALLLARRDDLYVERVQKRIASIQDRDTRLARSVHAATILCDRGDRTGAQELLRLGFVGLGTGYSPAGFWWTRGDEAATLAALEATRAEHATQAPWYRAEIDELLARMAGEGGGKPAIDPALLEEFWREQLHGGRVTAETLEELIELLGLAPEEGEAEPDPDAAAVLEAHAATLSGGRAALMTALALFMRGDRDGFEERLVELGTAPRGDRAFARGAVDSARDRGAFERATELLQRFARAAPPKSRPEVQTPIGSLPERAALEVELGALQLAAAESASAGHGAAPTEVRASVLARWRAALAEHPEPLMLLTYAAGFEEAAREALAAIEAARATARQPGALSERALLVATALSRASNDALGAYERLMESERILPAGPLGARTALLVDVARECGRLVEVKELALLRHGQKGADLGLAQHTLRLVAEVDGPRSALMLANGWPAGDRAWLSLWTRLAARARALGATAQYDADQQELRALERTYLERARESSPEAFAWSEGHCQLAALMLEAGEHDAARRSFTDHVTSSPASVRTSAAGDLRDAGHAEFALELLAPLQGAERPIGQQVSLLLGLGRADEAYRHLLDGAELDPHRSWSSLGPNARAKLRAAPEHALQLAGARAELGAVVGVEARGRVLSKLALLERIEHEDAAARLATLEELARLRPNDPRVQACLIEDWSATGRHADALAAIERQLEANDRLYATGLKSGLEPNRASELRRQRARALYAAAEAVAGPEVESGVDPSALLAAASDRLGRRFANADRWSHSLYGLAQRMEREDEGGMLVWRHGFTTEAHRRFWLETPPDPDSHAWNASLRAALLAGDVDFALDRAFAALRDGVDAAVDACAPVFGRVERLADLEQRLDAWVLESQRDLRAEPEAVDDVLERVAAVRRAIAEQRGDWATLVALTRERVARRAGEPNPRERAARRTWDPSAHELLAAALLRAGDYEAALGAANHAAGMRASAVLEIVAPALDAALAHSGPEGWKAGGPVRFGAVEPDVDDGDCLGIGGGAGGGVSASSVRVTAWDEFDDDRAPRLTATDGTDLRAELLLLTGRRDEALALEALRLKSAEGRASVGASRPRISVADEYMQHGLEVLDLEAERLLLAEVESGSGDRAVAMERLAELARRRGDQAAAERWRAESETLRGPEGSERSSSAASARTRGLAALDAGDHAGALALLAQAEARERRMGTWNGLSAAHAHGLAQARAAVLGLAAARTDLVCALAEHPRHERAARTRQLLQGR